MDLPGRPAVVRVHDHSADPRPLLRALADPLRALRDEQWVPLLHVRRGWQGGSHLRITAVPLASNTLRLDGFAAAAGRAAAALGAEPPDEAAYLARAAELGRWENVPPPHPPLRPQGHVDTGPDEAPDGWTPALVSARDQLASHLFEAVLRSASLEDADPVRHVARVMGVLAGSHPYGTGIATLPYRSHVEGVLSAAGARGRGLRGAFRERYAADAAFFTSCLTGAPHDAQTPVLEEWSRGFARCWGAAQALTAAGVLDTAALGAAAGKPVPVDEAPEPSAFHTAARHSGLADEEPYWQTAHRLLLNTLYPALTCLGVTPVQRYYLCFGLSEAADALLGQTWAERIAQYAPRTLPGHVREAAEAAAAR